VVRSKKEYTDRFPGELCTTITVTLKGGNAFSIDKIDYEGFGTRPMSWDTVIAKFNGLATPFTSERARKAIIDAVRNIEQMRIRNFTAILADLTG
jgi:2-methylcitrate dehydratase